MDTKDTPLDIAALRRESHIDYDLELPFVRDCGEQREYWVIRPTGKTLVDLRHGELLGASVVRWLHDNRDQGAFNLAAVLLMVIRAVPEAFTHEIVMIGILSALIDEILGKSRTGVTEAETDT